MEESIPLPKRGDAEPVATKRGLPCSPRRERRSGGSLRRSSRGTMGRELYRYCPARSGATLTTPRTPFKTLMDRVLRALPGEGRTIHLRPWLFRVARNESLSLIRNRANTVELTDAAMPSAHRSARPCLARLRMRLMDSFRATRKAKAAGGSSALRPEELEVLDPSCFEGVLGVVGVAEDRAAIAVELLTVLRRSLQRPPIALCRAPNKATRCVDALTPPRLGRDIDSSIRGHYRQLQSIRGSFSAAEATY